jgi:putative membrane-bound dehydrogenase-like protein
MCTQWKRMRNLPSATLSISSLACAGVLGLLAPLSAQNPAALPKAVTEKPPNPINGERPWAELQQIDIDNITSALPDKAQTGPAKPRKLLVFYRTDGFPHASIPHWNKCIELLGQKTGAFNVTLSQSYGDLMPEKLREYDAVFFNNTCRMNTPAPVKAALREFLESGKGFAGNHGAGDNWHDWDEGKEILGAEFVTHPYGRIQIKVDDAKSPLTEAFAGRPFAYADEIYAFKAPYSREKLRVLLSIDYPNSPEVAKAEQTMLARAAEPNARQFDKDALAAVRPDKDYALAWIRAWKRGRLFYCALGHRAEVTFDPAMVKFYLAGIQYALGDLKADDAPSGPLAPAAPASPEPVKTGAVPVQNPAESEQAKVVLQHVRFDPAFQSTTFAAPPMVHSPVFISAAPDGALFVSSDPNGSVGTTPGVGKIVRLRDTNGDGIADEALEVAKVDAPRGLVAHGGTVFVLHPPHISAFIDKDGDGLADEQRVLVKNIGWDYSKRRADHASNGLEIGIDGWLYAAIGDFGFAKAEGTDGRTLQLRGGGVVRVRQDGSGLELYSAGTRNILEAAISPLLDGFARDNTNDGGGWNTRFHHFSGLEDHGYPRLYKNFADEAVRPLADYGGGSGCGAAWVSEPGWPEEWNHRPFTVDWGKQHIAAHSVRQNGATYLETAAPVQLAQLKPELKPEEIRNNAFRPSDVDVDGRGYLYLASWVNGGFGAGEKCGVIFRMHPKGHAAMPLPDFAKATSLELAGLMSSPSHRARLEAQRVLLRHAPNAPTLEVLKRIASDQGAQLESRVAALFTLRQAASEKAFPFLAQLATDPSIAAWSIRALGDDERLAELVPAEPLLAGLKSADARTRREAVFAAARLGQSRFGTAVAALLDDTDEVVAHTAFRALAKLRASQACFAVLDDKSAAPAKRTGAIRALQSLHETAVVDGLIDRAAKENNAPRRRDLLSALCRLYNTEGEWACDSWGTRPDDRGPYYQPEPWSESQKIADSLLRTMSTLVGTEATWLGNELARNRANLKDATRQLLALAEKDASVLAPLFRNLADGDEVPLTAIPLLIQAAVAKDTDPRLRTDALVALCKTDSSEAFGAIIEGMTQKCDDGIHRARRAYHAAPRLENHHELFIAAAQSDKATARIAEEAVMLLASRVMGAPEARAAALAAIEENWREGPKRQAMMIVAARETRAPAAARLIEPLLRGEDKNLATLAGTFFKTAQIDPKKVNQTIRPEQMVGGLAPERVLAEVLQVKGDARRGEQLFTQQGCAACHTTKPEETLKGPYLGTIAATYKRRELAESILAPSKSIAQGFATNVFTKKDGSVLTGFVVREAATVVTLRTGAAQELTLAKSDITKREVLEAVSLMPPGLASNLGVEDFGSLLKYLEELTEKNSPKLP